MKWKHTHWLVDVEMERICTDGTSDGEWQVPVMLYGDIVYDPWAWEGEGPCSTMRQIEADPRHRLDAIKDEPLTFEEARTLC
jgi:hypothetical protein